MLYDMVELESVTNGDAMSICVKVVHYAPLICEQQMVKETVNRPARPKGM